MTEFKNLIDVANYFSDEKICYNHLVQLRWNGNICCPFCGSVKVYHFSDGKRFKCGEKECRKRFTATVGTIFENTKVPLSKWFVALYIITSHKKGISSLQLSKDISVTQKTAWFILHRIREMLRDKYPELLEGEIEVDETYVGGKFKNKHKSKRVNQRGINDPKTPVFAIVQRGKKKVFTEVIPVADRNTIFPIIERRVKKGSTVMSDSSGMYARLKSYKYAHQTVNHEDDEYVRGDFHTNTIEGFFGLLKRGIIGIYHQVSRKHLQRYCDEFSWRYENREAGEAERFDFSLVNCEGRLKYKDLIAKPEKDIPAKEEILPNPYLPAIWKPKNGDSSQADKM